MAGNPHLWIKSPASVIQKSSAVDIKEDIISGINNRRDKNKLDSGLLVFVVDIDIETQAGWAISSCYSSVLVSLHCSPSAVNLDQFDRRPELTQGWTNTLRPIPFVGNRNTTSLLAIEKLFRRPIWCAYQDFMRLGSGWLSGKTINDGSHFKELNSMVAGRQARKMKKMKAAIAEISNEGVVFLSFIYREIF